MDRREFMKISSAAGAIAWLAVTRPLSAQTISGYSNAVPFVLDPSVSGLSDADLQTLFQVSATVTPEQQAATYPQSVASGDPRPSGVVLWARVDPSQQAGPSGDLVAWQISSDSSFGAGAVLIEGVSMLQQERDSTVKVSVSNTVLEPYTSYYYRFLYNGVPSRAGQFKTLPDAAANLPQLKLGYVVCQDYGNGYYNALQYLAQEQVDYVVHLGDYIYETINAPTFQNNPVRTVQPFPSGGVIPQNVDDYRHLYKIYRSDPNQQAVHERFTYIMLWDDHEFANDCHQDFHPDNNTAPNTATTPQPELRQAANQAWSEYGLADTPFDPSQNWDSSIQVYRSFSFGSLAELIVTDERLYRDGPPCGDSQEFQRYFSVGCSEMGDSARSMLGVTQRAWFLNQLASTSSTWKLWANEVMLMQLKLGPIYIDLDQWDGYQQERNLILNAVKDQKIDNFIALTGDLHTFLAGYLKTNFDNPFEPHVGIELMVGSISSANFAEEIESALPLPSRPLPAKQMGIAPNLLEPVIRALNPWIQYWDSSTHGYGILTMTPEQLVCEFKAVSTITQPAATLVPLRTFTIPAGRVHLDQG
jgi:alkaline phosphatase D